MIRRAADRPRRERRRRLPGPGGDPADLPPLAAAVPGDAGPVTVQQERYRVSERQACRVMGQHRTTQRHRGKVVDLKEDQLHHRLHQVWAMDFQFDATTDGRRSSS